VFIHFLQLDNCIMPGVGLNIIDYLLPVFILFPNQFGVSHECIEVGKFLGFELFPQAVFSAESRNSALGGNPGTREHDYRFSGFQSRN
jgi:hypothetical protein